MQKPNFWKAFAAYLIDYIGIQVFIVTVLLLIISKLMTGIEINPTIVDIIGLTLFALYFALLEHKNGASFGKRLLKIKILSKKGNVLSVGRVLAAYLIDEVIAALFMVIAVYLTAQFLSFPLHVIGTIFPVVQNVWVIIAAGIPVFWYIFYYAYSEYKWGYTIGKQIMGLHVVREM